MGAEEIHVELRPDGSTLLLKALCWLPPSFRMKSAVHWPASCMFCLKATLGLHYAPLFLNRRCSQASCFLFLDCPSRLLFILRTQVICLLFLEASSEPGGSLCPSQLWSH